MRKSIQLLMLAIVVPLVAPYQADARVVRFVVEQTRLSVVGGSGRPQPPDGDPKQIG